MFSIGEICNLLASTDHRQRLYAFDMLTSSLHKSDVDTVVRNVLNKDTSGVSLRVL